MDNNELKPCPFCGNNAESIVDYDQCGGKTLMMSAYVRCTVCGVNRRVKFDAYEKPFSVFTDAFGKVIDAWNQRV